MELRGLVTYREKQDSKEEVFMDTVPRAGAHLKSGVIEPTIDMNSLLSLLIADSSLRKSRTAHMYVCEDRELSKSRVGLKILYE